MEPRKKGCGPGFGDVILNVSLNLHCNTVECCGAVWVCFCGRRIRIGIWQLLHVREFTCPRTQKMTGTSKEVRKLDAFMSVLFDAQQWLVGFIEVLIQYNILELQNRIQFTSYILNYQAVHFVGLHKGRIVCKLVPCLLLPPSVCNALLVSFP